MAAGGRDGSFQESGASTGCFIDNLAPAILPLQCPEWPRRGSKSRERGQKLNSANPSKSTSWQVYAVAV